MRYVERIPEINADQIISVSVTTMGFDLVLTNGFIVSLPNFLQKPHVGDYWVTRSDGSCYAAYQKSFESRYKPAEK